MIPSPDTGAVYAVAPEEWLDPCGARRATWLGSFVGRPTDEIIRARVQAELPWSSGASQYRLVERAVRELERPIAGNEPQRDLARRTLTGEQFGAAIMLSIENSDELMVLALGDGEVRRSTRAVTVEDSLVAIVVHAVPLGWPHGAARLRGVFLEEAFERIARVERGTGQTCAGTLVLTYFLEPGVPGAELGLDMQLALSYVPNFKRPGVPSPLNWMLHAAILSTRELAAFQGLQNKGAP